MSVSNGNISGFGSTHLLRQSMTFINVPTMTQAEAYIADASGLFDNNGNLTKEATKEFLRKFRGH